MPAAARLGRVALLLALSPGLVGLASVHAPTDRAASTASPLYSPLRRLAPPQTRPRAGTVGAERPRGPRVPQDEAWLSVSDGDDRTTAYAGRDLQELFDKQLRFGNSPVAVGSERYRAWDAPDDEGNATTAEAECEDDQSNKAEYEVRMHVGRLKLAAQRAMARGLLSEARILYGRCLEARPNDAGVLANRALVLLRLGEAALAEDDCTAALHLTGERKLVAKLLYRRGLARQERGRMSQALKDVQDAALLEPRSPQIAELARALQHDAALLDPTLQHAPGPQAPAEATQRNATAEGARSVGRTAKALLDWADLGPCPGGSLTEPSSMLKHVYSHSEVPAPPLTDDGHEGSGRAEEGHDLGGDSDSLAASSSSGGSFSKSTDELDAPPRIGAGGFTRGEVGLEGEEALVAHARGIQVP